MAQDAIHLFQRLCTKARIKRKHVRDALLSVPASIQGADVCTHKPTQMTDSCQRSILIGQIHELRASLHANGTHTESQRDINARNANTRAEIDKDGVVPGPGANPPELAHKQRRGHHNRRVSSASPAPRRSSRTLPLFFLRTKRAKRHEATRLRPIDPSEYAPDRLQALQP